MNFYFLPLTSEGTYIEGLPQSPPPKKKAQKETKTKKPNHLQTSPQTKTKNQMNKTKQPNQTTTTNSRTGFIPASYSYFLYLAFNNSEWRY